MCYTVIVTVNIPSASHVHFKDIPIGQINSSGAKKMWVWTEFLDHRHNDRIV